MPRRETRSSSRTSPKPSSSAPARRPSSNVAQPEPKQPGLFGHMVSTAAGTAVGSFVGNTAASAASEALFGGREGGESKQEHYDLQQQNQNQGLCQYEIRQFVECVQNQGEITFCKEFNEALKKCKLANNLS